jgi:hypothetical protein
VRIFGDNSSPAYLPFWQRTTIAAIFLSSLTNIRNDTVPVIVDDRGSKRPSSGRLSIASSANHQKRKLLMSFRTHSFHLLIMAATFVASTGALRAANVAFVGFTEGTEVSDWLTPSTPKTFDIDGDNRYGSSIGAVHWAVIGHQEQPAGSPALGWAYLGETSFGQFRNPAYASVDDLSNPSVKSAAGIAAVQNPGQFTFELTGLPSDYVGRTVRVGVMADILTQPEWAADVEKTFQVVQTVGGAGDSGVIPLRGGDAADGQPEMYFFDLTGVTSGDRFSIVTTGPSGGQAGYLGPVSWDISAVPEPSSFVLVLVGTMFALRRAK